MNKNLPSKLRIRVEVVDPLHEVHPGCGPLQTLWLQQFRFLGHVQFAVRQTLVTRLQALQEWNLIGQTYDKVIVSSKVF